MKKKQFVGLTIGLLIILGALLLPVPEGLSYEGVMTTAVLIMFLVFIVLETMPIGAACILSLALLPVTGAVPDLKTALSGYTTPILYFVLVSFGISEAVTKVPLSRRILIGLAKKLKA